MKEQVHDESTESTTTDVQQIDKLMDLVQDDKIDIKKLYDDIDLYFLFHRVCVMSVFSKEKWKKNRCSSHFTTYTDASDEAIALLILDNNSRRWKDIHQTQSEGNNDISDCSMPKYTEANKGKHNDVSDDNNGCSRFKGKGWSLEGRNKYFETLEAIEDYREKNEGRVNDMEKQILAMYRTMCQKTTTYDIDDNNLDEYDSNEIRRKREENEQRLNDLMSRQTKRRRHRIN